MSKLRNAISEQTKAEVERIVRAFWAKQEVPRDPRKRIARPTDKLATEWLRATGFNVKKAETLQKQQRAEWERMAPRAAADAAKRWAGHIKRTQASATAWATNLMATPGGGTPPSDSSFFLARPISILASDPGILKATHFEPGNSFAKILVDRKSSDVDTLTFIFAFHNVAGAAFLFDFDTLLNSSGHLRVSVGAGFVNSGEVNVDAKLDVLTASPVTDTQNVAAVGALGGAAPFFQGDSNERTISLTRFLTAPGVVIESDAIAIAQVSLVLSYDLDDARVVADFNAGNFRVQCPVVLIARRSLPAKASGLMATGLNI